MKQHYRFFLTAALVLGTLTPALAQTTPQAMDNQIAPSPNAAAESAAAGQPPATMAPAAPTVPAVAAPTDPAAPAVAAPAGATATTAAAPVACTSPTPAQTAMLADPNLPSSLAKLYANRENDFNKMDTDCDGFVTMAEWQKGDDDRFAAADTNHDGSLSKDEAANIVGAFEEEAAKNPGEIVDKRAHTLENRLGNIDGNNDGIITKQEWDAYYSARFTKLDKNGDGKLDITEFQTDDEEARRRREP